MENTLAQAPSPYLSAPVSSNSALASSDSASTSSVKQPAKTLSEVFNSRRNAIGFMRWLMAFLVIFSHAGPIAGFWGGKDIGVDFSHQQQSLGGLAVAGFFFYSGFLITRSAMGRTSIIRYLWRRCLRIFPAFWLALVITAFVIAPIAWVGTGHALRAYFSLGPESPWYYVGRNFILVLRQRPLAGMGSETPYYILHGQRDWNGSAWTIIYEFGCYLLVALLAVFGMLRNRIFAAIAFGFLLFLNFMQWTVGIGALGSQTIFKDIFILMFLAPFATGAIMQVFADKIPFSGRVALGCALISIATLHFWGWNAIGQVTVGYCLMWLAVKLPIYNWEKYGDFSYGVYIFAWPLMTFYTFFNIEKHPVIYLTVLIVSVHVLAFLSWHLIEKPAMSIKSWTPKWLVRLEQASAKTIKVSGDGGMAESLRQVNISIENKPYWWRVLRYVPLVILTISVFVLVVTAVVIRYWL